MRKPHPPPNQPLPMYQMANPVTDTRRRQLVPYYIRKKYYLIPDCCRNRYSSHPSNKSPSDVGGCKYVRKRTSVRGPCILSVATVDTRQSLCYGGKLKHSKQTIELYESINIKITSCAHILSHLTYSKYLQGQILLSNRREQCIHPYFSLRVSTIHVLVYFHITSRNLSFILCII